MCNCINIRPGSTEAFNQMVTLEVPEGLDLRMNTPDREPRKKVRVDPCIRNVLKFLWAEGIRTTCSCCGHNTFLPTVGVIDEDIPKMKQLGYRVWNNPSRENGDIFIVDTDKELFEALSQLSQLSKNTNQKY